MRSPMALDSIGIKRNGVLAGSPVQVFPSEAITLFAQLGAVGGDIARFSIETLSGEVVFGPVEKRTDLFSSQVNLDILAPGAEGNYILVVTELRPLFPDDTKAMPFEVTVNAPQPPDPPGFFEEWKGLLIFGGVVVALVALSPAINRGIKRIT